MSQQHRGARDGAPAPQPRPRTGSARARARRVATAVALRAAVAACFALLTFGVAFRVTPLHAAEILLDRLDLNGDRAISMSDVILDLPYLGGGTPAPPSTPPVTSPDVNAGGAVDRTRVDAILERLGAVLDAPPASTVTPAPTASFILAPPRAGTATPPVAPSPAPPRAPTATPTLIPAAPGTRDKLKQPFASTSIWNMPIGAGASYVFAGIRDWTAYGVFLEENIVINRPAAPPMPVFYNGDAWAGGSRCDAQGAPLFSAPLPADYVVPGAAAASTPNYAAAILAADGASYLQAQPLTHCTPGGPWTSFVRNATVSLYGDGILGAQGGSHLSSVGGAIRVGEWRARVIRHALKTVLDPANYSQSGGGFRWPAVSADAGYRDDYRGANPALKMGSLLALRPDFDVGRLQTEPGRIVARAFMDYGCYIVDSGWAPAYLPVEQGPDGNAADEFRREFGFPMKDPDPNSPWSRDWRSIITSAYVVDNNAPATVGGGGAPRRPLAPPIGN